MTTTGKHLDKVFVADYQGNAKCKVMLHQQKAIAFAIKYISEQIPEVDSVILYGSCSRGEAKFSSDVDLLVTLKKIDDSVKKKCFDVRTYLRNESATEIDVHFCQTSTLEKSINHFYKMVRRDGVRVW